MQQQEPRRPYPIFSLVTATVAEENRWHDTMSTVGGFMKFVEYFCYEADWTIPTCGPTAAICIDNCVTLVEQAIADTERGIPTVFHGASSAVANNNSVAFSL